MGGTAGVLHVKLLNRDRVHGAKVAVSRMDHHRQVDVVEGAPPNHELLAATPFFGRCAEDRNTTAERRGDLGDGKPILAAGVGVVCFVLNGKTIQLKNVLHVPDLDIMLLLVHLHCCRGHGCSYLADSSGMFLTFPNFVVEINDRQDCTAAISPCSSNSTPDYQEYDLATFQTDLTTATCRRAHKAWVLTRRQRRLQAAQDAESGESSQSLPSTLPSERRQYDVDGQVVFRDVTPPTPQSDPIDTSGDCQGIEDSSSNPADGCPGLAERGSNISFDAGGSNNVESSSPPFSSDAVQLPPY